MCLLIWERERDISWLPPIMPQLEIDPTPQICALMGLNPQPFSVWDGSPTKWTTQPGFFIIFAEKSVPQGWNMGCLAQCLICGARWDTPELICPSKILTIQQIHLLCSMLSMHTMPTPRLCCLIHGLVGGDYTQMPCWLAKMPIRNSFCCWLFGDPHSGLFVRMAWIVTNWVLPYCYGSL